MPAGTHSARGSTGAARTDRTYRASPTMHQARFPARRRAMKTYGRNSLGAASSSRPPQSSASSDARRRSLRQSTLTQIDFMVPVDPDALIGPEEFDGSDRDYGENRGRAGEESEHESDRPQKRRRTVSGGASLRASTETLGRGDKKARETRASSSFHTQTLTQFMGDKGQIDADDWDLVQIGDSQEDNEGHRFGRLDLTSPGKGLDKLRSPLLRGEDKEVDEAASAISRTPSVIPQTPCGKRIVTEIPSSQPSPFTPMLARYSPASNRSPLIERSTNKGNLPATGATAAPASMAKRKTPRNMIIEDSFSTVPSSSSMPQTQTQLKARQAGSPHITSNNSSGSRPPLRDITREARTGRFEIPDTDDETDSLGPTPIRPLGSRRGPKGDGTENETPTPLTRKKDILDEDVRLEMREDSEETPTPLASKSVVLDEDGSPHVEAGTPTPSTRKSVAPRKPASEDAEVSSPLPAMVDEEVESADELILNVSSNPPSPSPQKLRSSGTQVEKETPVSSPQKTSPAQDSYEKQTQLRTQFSSKYMESQRVPLDVIRSMGPQTDRSDVIISIHPEHAARIAAGTKNHEFRNYRIPLTVSRIWIYVTRPACELRYMAVIGGAKEPGQIPNGGVGNEEFNVGRGSKFAYELEQVYELNNPVSLELMKRNGWVEGPPQKYTYAPPTVVGSLLANLRCKLFEKDEACDHHHGGSDAVEQAIIARTGPEGEIISSGRKTGKPSSSLGISISQELEEQLRSDIVAHSTQMPSSKIHAPTIIPSSQESLRRSGRLGKRRAPPPPPSRRPPSAMPPQITPARRGFDGGEIRPSQATTASQPSTPPRAPPSSVLWHQHDEETGDLTPATRAHTSGSACASSMPSMPPPSAGATASVPQLPDLDEDESGVLNSGSNAGRGAPLDLGSSLPPLPDSLLRDDDVRQPPEIWDSEEDDDYEL